MVSYEQRMSSNSNLIEPRILVEIIAAGNELNGKMSSVRARLGTPPRARRAPAAAPAARSPLAYTTPVYAWARSYGCGRLGVYAGRPLALLQPCSQDLSPFRPCRSARLNATMIVSYT